MFCVDSIHLNAKLIEKGLRELVQLPSSLPPADVEVGLGAALLVSETRLCALCPASSARLDFPAGAVLRRFYLVEGCPETAAAAP